MEILGWLLVGALFLYFIIRRSTNRKDAASRTKGKSREGPMPDPVDSSYKELFAAHKELLSARWRAMNDRESALSLGFKKWCWDEATEAQIQLLTKLGVPRKARSNLSKGQASDLIGLFQRADFDDKEKLEFFGGYRDNLSQTAAKEQLRLLFTDEANRDKWNNRPDDPENTPADFLQKEFARLYGIKLPAKATIKDAESTIDTFIAEQTKQGADHDLETRLTNVYRTMEEVFDELSNAKTCHEDYEIKKPTIKAVRTALMTIGLETLEKGELDTWRLVEQLLIDNPDLERPFDGE